MGNEINRDSAVYFDSVRRHLARARARLPIADVQRDGALCVSVLSRRYLSAPWVVLLPRSAALRTPMGARARSIFARYQSAAAAFSRGWREDVGLATLAH